MYLFVNHLPPGNGLRLLRPVPPSGYGRPFSPWRPSPQSRRWS